jgi:DNA invertase Pin-like site-specific DNA recombinase
MMVNGYRRSVIYTRESTKKQSLSSYAQILACKTYHENNGRLPPLLPDAYSDHARSGGILLENRKAGHQLLLDLERGDHLLVAAFDRLGRDIPDLILTVRLLHKRGVIVHLLDLSFLLKFEIDDPNTEVYLTQVASLAQFERHRGSARTKQGLAAQRARGYATTGEGHPVGYKRIPNPEWRPDLDPRLKIGRDLLIPDPDDQAYFDRAYALWMGGDKVPEVQRILKSWKAASGWNYQRLYKELRRERRRREQEEFRIERLRVTG